MAIMMLKNIILKLGAKKRLRTNTSSTKTGVIIVQGSLIALSLAFCQRRIKKLKMMLRKRLKWKDKFPNSNFSMILFFIRLILNNYKEFKEQKYLPLSYNYYLDSQVEIIIRVNKVRRKEEIRDNKLIRHTKTLPTRGRVLGLFNLQAKAN
jgi:hypothetical protein